jgi:20S proteasome alpha/beta subunit
MMTPFRERDAWERRNMTVCIAAACQSEGKGRIILCTDWKISGALGSAETKLKMRNFGQMWLCLTAGSEPDINAIIKIFRDEFTKLEVAKATIDDVAAVTLTRATLAQRKRDKVNELTQAQYALSYDDFLSFGKDKLPSDLHREALLSIRDLKLGTDCILAGFEPAGFSHLIRADSDGRVSVHEEFAVVGEGGYLAQSVLLHRQHSDTHDLSRALYAVYEAKRYAEGAASVGKYTSFLILSPDGGRVRITSAGKLFLEEQYKKFGPKDVPSAFDIPESAVEKVSYGSPDPTVA